MIWVIAGTRNARELINVLLQKGLRVIASTVSEYGSSLLGVHENLTLLSKALTIQDMIQLLDEYNVSLIIDASHPYAAEVSMNAINAAKQRKIRYIRYERENVIFNGVKEFNNYQKIVEYLKDKEGNILLSIGSKNLHNFSTLKDRLYARVLPVKNSIDLCEKAGIKPDRILGMLHSFSKDFHKLLYNELGIKFLVSKESGEEGGVNEKVQAAIECGIEVLMLERPVIDYPELSYDIDEIVRIAGR